MSKKKEKEVQIFPYLSGKLTDYKSDGKGLSCREDFYGVGIIQEIGLVS